MAAHAHAVVTCSVIVSLMLAAPAQAVAQAGPPNIPDRPTAQAELDTLIVASEGVMSGYSREEFPHWITVSGTCSTRETVLKRDGTDVVTDRSCTATSGTWYSPFDGATWTSASDVDVDHVVPLAEAWRSGADKWTTARRQEFANDLSRPELIAVTDDVNQAKGDQDPSTWRPVLASYHCAYARMWIRTKHHWELSLQTSEKSALQTMLNAC